MLRLTKILFLTLVFSLGMMFPYAEMLDFRIPISDFIFLGTFIFWILCLLLRKMQFRFHPFFLLIGFYYAAIMLSAFFSSDFQISFIKLLGETYLLCLPILAFNLITGRKDLKRALIVWLGGASVSIIVGLITIFLFYVHSHNWLLNYTLYSYGAVPVGNYPRVCSTLSSASLLCNYLSVTLMIVFVCGKLNWVNQKMTYFLIFTISIVAIFTISSGLGAFPISAGVWYYFNFRKTHKFFSRTVLIGGISAAFLFIVLNFVALEKYRLASEPFYIFGFEFFTSPRVKIWTESFKTFTEYFFVGKGVGQNSCFVSFQNTDGSISILTDAHNVFLSVASQEGIFGLLAVIILSVYLSLKTFMPKFTGDERSVLRMGLGIAFISAFVYQGITGSFEDSRHIWMLIGIFLAAGAKELSDFN